MTIFFAPKPDTATSSTSSKGAGAEESQINERAETIEMKHKHENDILKRVLEITKAVEVKPTEEEAVAMRQLEEELVRSDQDRIRTRADLEARQQEEALLAAAKASINTQAA